MNGRGFLQTYYFLRGRKAHHTRTPSCRTETHQGTESRCAEEDCGKSYKDIRRIGYGLGEVSIVIMQNKTVIDI